MSSDQNGQAKKSGVALVIVLALLALLMIVSASFLFTMRIERAGSANNRHDWVATQVAHAGFDYALASIDHFFLNTGENGWHQGANPFWTYVPNNSSDDSQPDRNRKLILHADTFVSLREDLSHDQAGNVARAKGFIPLGSKASGFLPPGLAYRGSASKLILDSEGRHQQEIDPPEWIPVRPYGVLDKDSIKEEEKKEKYKNPVIGRYAFMAFDTTGLIDVNHVMTNGSDRGWGRDPAELQLDYNAFATDFWTPSAGTGALTEDSVKDFMALRDSDDGYISLQDMAALNEFFDSTYSRHLKTFSYEPLWPAWTNAESVVDLDEDAEGIYEDREQELENAFIESGLTEDQARYAVCGLIDYVDEDGLPYGKNDQEKLCRPVTERMPLMAGGMIRFELERWHTPELQGEGEEKVVVLKDNEYTYKMKGDWAIPFTWMFYGLPKPGEFEIEGKVAITPFERRSAHNPYADLFPKKVFSLKGEYEQGNHSGDVNREGTDIIQGKFGTDENVAFIPKDSGEDKTLKMQVSAFFAGASYLRKGNEVLRRYPPSPKNFNTSTPEKVKDGGTWMQVDIDTEHTGAIGGGFEKITFEEAGKKSRPVLDRDSKKPKKNPQGQEYKTDCMIEKAEFVVWVDIFDPRYGYGDLGDDVSHDKKRGIYRTSHRISRNNGRHTKITEMSILELSNAGEPFDGIQTEVRNLSNPLIEKTHREDIVSIVRDYFKKEGKTLFSSLLTSYIFDHPKILQDSLSLHVDGVRAGAPNGKSDVIREDPDDRGDAGAYWRAYVKNGPIESAGELGFLPIGQWLTIRLYDYGDEELANGLSTAPDNKIPGYDGYDGRGDEPVNEGYHTVLDHFAVDRWRKVQGRISVDSSEQKVVASPFYKLPVEVPEKDRHGTVRGGATISGEDAMQLAKVVMHLRQDKNLNKCSDFGKIFRPIEGMRYELGHGYATGKEIACSGDFKSGSSLPSMVVYHTMDDGGRGYAGEFEREALIAKAYNLFTNRGKTFIIVVKAQAYTPGFFRGGVKDETGAIHASRTLVAEVWRDTIDENKNGVFPWKIGPVLILDE